MALSDYFNKKPVIESVRLLLRPMKKTDIPDLMEWMPDESIYTYWGKSPGKSDKNPALMFKKTETPNKSFHLGIAVKPENKSETSMFI